MKTGRAPAAAGGVTLVELLVVVVILGLLASIGFPAYQQYARESKRAAAQAVLTDAAARQEQFFLDNKTYTTTIGTGGLSMAGSTEGGHYAISVDAPSGTCPIASCYVLRATPQGSQTADSCGAITYSFQSEKLPQGCW